MDDPRKDEDSKKSPTYFSYGPYRSNNQEQPATEQSQVEMYATRNTEITEATVVAEVIPPSSDNSLEAAALTSNQDVTSHVVSSDDGSNSQRTRSPKFSMFKGVFPGFVAGALVVGGLMIVSDKANLFTDDVQANNTSQQTSYENSQAVNSVVGDQGSASETSTAFNVVRPNNIAEIAKTASPAVVKIEAFSRSTSSSGGNSIFSDDPFFRQFFGDDQSSNNSNGGTLRQTGMGTGFIFEKTGYILTNEHVINGADEIRVTVEGYDKPFIAKLLGNSFELDLAALKIEGENNFSILPLGKTDNINVGDWVVAIGNPYGFEHTVTVGVLSAKERPISIQDTNGTRNYKHLLQTDASINPGNSGGPLLNLNGEVIGINTAVSTQAQGIGFAIPTSTISTVLDNLKNNVAIPKEPAPYIGVSLQDIDESWISDLKLSNTDGALVNAVERKSPAFKAGLKTYDVILDVNQAKVANTEALIAKIKTYKVGDIVTIGLIRDGKRLEIKVDIGDRNQANK